ncbi:MAG: carbon dioxide concentrating mechanism protein [Pleurocapsa sp.]
MIYLPPPQPVADRDIRINGDVEIHPTASLAPGVILEAAPNNRITIGANVCLGMGVILNAGQGSIDIESGVTLGSGVLVIGESKIGSNACIGTATTIFQASVSPMTVINPGSLIGDISRQIKLTENEEQSNTNSSNHNNGAVKNFSPSSKEKTRTNKLTDNQEKVSTKSPNSAENKKTKKSQDNKQNSLGDVQEKELKKTEEPVVGQVYINELLVTLFPHRQGFNSSNSKDNSKNST